MNGKKGISLNAVDVLVLEDETVGPAIQIRKNYVDQVDIDNSPSLRWQQLKEQIAQLNFSCGFDG